MPNIIRTGGSVDLTPNGATVTPTNNYVTWLACAKLPDIYGSLANVVSNSGVMSTLASSSNAVSYMLRSTTTIMSAVVISSTAMNALAGVKSTLVSLNSNTTWWNAILGSSTALSSLKSCAFAVVIPTMTSNTTPSGTAFADSEDATANASWKAFDNNDISTSVWSSTQTAFPHYLGYHFTTSIIPISVKALGYIASGNCFLKNFTVQGSSNGSSYVNLTNCLYANSSVFQEFPINTTYAYTYLRINCTDSYYARTDNQIITLQFYGLNLN